MMELDFVIFFGKYQLLSVLYFEYEYKKVHTPPTAPPCGVQSALLVVVIVHNTPKLHYNYDTISDFAMLSGFEKYQSLLVLNQHSPYGTTTRVYGVT